MLIKKKILFLYPFLFFALTGCGNEGSFKNGVSDSAPTAYDASAATLINSSIDIILNGTDPENRPLTYRIIEGPARGTLTRKEYNIYRYSPENNYEGHDNFTFRVNDGKNDSNTGRVAIHVSLPNRPPVASDAEVYTGFNTPCEIILAASDADNDPFEITILQQPQHGTLSVTGEKLFYHPHNNYYGFDTILFQAKDRYSTGNIGTIKIEVGVTNTPPEAVDIVETINEDEEFTIPFSVTPDSYEIWDSDILYEIVTQPSSGVVEYDAINGEWRYTPPQNYNGTVTFYYRAFDGKDYSAAAAVTLNISPLNDAPAVADITVIVTESFREHNIQLQGVDPDGDALTYTVSGISSLPGSFSYSGSNGSSVYTSPGAPSNFGCYELMYTARDSSGTESNTGSIYIVIRPENVLFVNPDNQGLETGQCWHQGFRYISDAIASAGPGDQIWLTGGNGVTHRIKPGLYTVADLTGKFNSDEQKGLTIIGGFSTGSYNISDTNPVLRPSILDGENIAEHVIVSENFCIIKNITVINGHARHGETENRGGGIYIPDNREDIAIDNININNCKAGSGGGLYTGRDSSGIVIQNTIIRDNSSEIRGGGAAIAENSTVTMTDLLFSENHTEDFGGGLSNLGRVTASGCTFSYNEAQYGGGLYDHNSQSEYTACDFIYNTALISGGGIFNYGAISLVNCDSINNNSAPKGGGIFNDASGIADPVNVNILNCTVSGNTSTLNGAGIYNLHSALLLEECEIINNTNSGVNDGNDGGGIYCEEGSHLTVNNSHINNNRSNMNGGGIFSDSYSTLTLNSTDVISNSSASGDGGGIFLSHSEAFITSSEISGNSASSGGGICLTAYSRLHFNGNSAPYPYLKLNNAVLYGGGLYAENSLFEINNAHIFNNSFSNAAGSGGGVYAVKSNVSFISVYIERNHGPESHSPQNYSGFHLQDCSISNLNLLRSTVHDPANNDYNTLFANFLQNSGYPYENQFYPGL